MNELDYNEIPIDVVGIDKSHGVFSCSDYRLDDSTINEIEKLKRKKN